LSPATRTFATRAELADALSATVAQGLAAAVAARGKASLAVSGGSTPALFFPSLSTRDDVPWEKVTITLVDERWVDDTSDRSNAKLVKAKLLQGPAAAATFVPLYGGGAEPDRNGLTAAAGAGGGGGPAPPPVFKDNIKNFHKKKKNK
jgi:6-phosphogluconolactonase